MLEVLLLLLLVLLLRKVSVVMKRCQSQQKLAPDNVYGLVWVGEGNYLKE